MMNVQFSGAILRVKYGSEGPKYDPYAYREVTVTRNRPDGEPPLVVTVHDGLAVWLDVKGLGKSDARRVMLSPEQLRANFEHYTGIDWNDVDRLEAKLRGPKNRCPNCTSRNLKFAPGYVGECMQFCEDCGAVLWSEDPTPYVA